MDIDSNNKNVTYRKCSLQQNILDEISNKYNIVNLKNIEQQEN